MGPVYYKYISVCSNGSGANISGRIQPDDAWGHYEGARSPEPRAMRPQPARGRPSDRAREPIATAAAAISSLVGPAARIQEYRSQNSTVVRSWMKKTSLAPRGVLERPTRTDQPPKEGTSRRRTNR